MFFKEHLWVTDCENSSKYKVFFLKDCHNHFANKKDFLFWKFKYFYDAKSTSIANLYEKSIDHNSDLLMSIDFFFLNVIYIILLVNI